MKFIVSSTLLANSLQAVNKVIVGKNAMPIRENILFEIQGKELLLTASDEDNTIKAKLEVNSAEGDFAFTVPARHLIEIIGKFPEMPLTFDVSDLTKIQLISETGKYQLVGTSADEYPQLKDLKEPASFTMAGDTLLKAVSKTLFATADNELRPIMNGICFVLSEEGLVCAATDSHQLVRYTNSEAKGQDATFVLPKKPANLLKNVLPKEKGEVKVAFDDNSACFTLESYTIYCRLIEGKYPNFNAVIPTQNTNVLSVDRAGFTAAINRVAVCSNQASHLIKLDIRNDQMILSAQDYDFSTFATETIVCQFDGTPMAVGLKAPFLLDILNHLDSDDAVLELSDPSRAVLILPSSNLDNEELLMLLMPMTLGD